MNVDEKRIERLAAEGNLRYAGNRNAVDRFLEKANRLLNGYGVEPMRSEGAWDNYYGDTVALYVNMGDTYVFTLVYDVEAEQFFATDWGTWMEGWESEHVPADDDDYGEDAPIRHEVIVGNLGSVYSGTDGKKAYQTFKEYGEMSDSGHGRAAGEPVTLMEDGEIVDEW